MCVCVYDEIVRNRSKSSSRRGEIDVHYSSYIRVYI